MDKSNDRIPKAEWRLAEAIARKALRTQAANARFNAMTPEKKRLTVARDVLKWLASGKFSAGRGYLSSPSLYFNENTQQRQMREVTINGYSCEVCAIGAAVCAATERAGTSLYVNGKLVGVDDGVSIHTALKGIFDSQQLALMELAFEGPWRAPRETVRLGFPDSPVDEYGRRNTPEFAKAIAWHDAHKGEDAMDTRQPRLVALWENIAANGGTFVP